MNLVDNLSVVLGPPKNILPSHIINLKPFNNMLELPVWTVVACMLAKLHDMS